jgi:hypothetical protein
MSKTITHLKAYLTMKHRKRVLQILSLLFVFGGIVRLFANKKIFEFFLMKDLWVDHVYFIYIYRVLGAFVILTGFILFTVSGNIKKYLSLFNVLTWGFILVGLVMAVTGFLLKLPIIFYIPDFIFCFIIAGFFYQTNKQSFDKL